MKYYSGYKRLTAASISHLCGTLVLGNLSDARMCSDGGVILEFVDDDDFCLSARDLRQLAEYFGAPEEDVFVDGADRGVVLVEVSHDCRARVESEPAPVADAFLVSPHTTVINIDRDPTDA